jgi:hypothetical protein
VCIDKTFAKTWQVTWDPDLDPIRDLSDRACLNHSYAGTYTLEQSASNPCLFESAAKAIRWVNTPSGTPDYCEDTTLPRVRFLIQKTGIPATLIPGRNFLVYFQWEEKHWDGAKYVTHNHNWIYSSDRPAPDLQNCMSQITVDNPTRYTTPATTHTWSCLRLTSDFLDLPITVDPA